MAYRYFNNNSNGRTVGDCTVRAISCALGKSWDDVYWDLANEGYRQADMPSSNAVTGAYLHENGFRRYMLPDDDSYRVRDFANSHPIGIYILATGNHLVTVRDGSYFDAWDSGSEIPETYWTRENYKY